MTDVVAALTDRGIRLGSYDVGDHKVLCPKCSAQRRNKRDPCLSVKVDGEGGATWNCHHCGFTGDVPVTGSANGYASQPRQVTRPKPPQKVDSGQRLFEWFAGRGISREIVEAMGVYSAGEGEHRAIVFPYWHGGALVAYSVL